MFTQRYPKTLLTHPSKSVFISLSQKRKTTHPNSVNASLTSLSRSTLVYQVNPTSKGKNDRTVSGYRCVFYQSGPQLFIEADHFLHCFNLLYCLCQRCSLSKRIAVHLYFRFEYSLLTRPKYH